MMKVLFLMLLLSTVSPVSPVAVAEIASLASPRTEELLWGGEKLAGLLGPLKQSPFDEGWRDLDYAADVDTDKSYACITLLSPLTFDEIDEIEAELSCKARKDYIKALGSTTVVLRGLSFACKAFPHLGAKVSAEIMNFGGYVTGSIGFYVSLQDCRDEKSVRIHSLKQACLELRASGIDCAGVGE